MDTRDPNETRTDVNIVNQRGKEDRNASMGDFVSCNARRELAQAVFGVPNHSAVIQLHNLVNIAQQIVC